MSIRPEWQALGANIEAVVDLSAHLSPALLNHPAPLFKEAAHAVLAEAERTWAAVDAFLDRHAASLPQRLLETRTEWRARRDLLTDPGRQNAKHESPLHAAFAWGTFLGGLRAHMNLLLADAEATWRSAVERAFVHLQRVLVTNATERDRWRKAFKKGETSCEQLGGVHLLSHQVWGFKANSAGERTDLVLAEPIDIASAGLAERAGTALVLTEWKRITPVMSVDAAVSSITTQVNLYRRGSLATVELRSTCYGVLVTDKRLKAIPSDIQTNEYNLRFLNVAVDAEVPSVAAKGKK